MMFCQLEKVLRVLFILIYIIGCSHQVEKQAVEPIASTWFNIPLRFGVDESKARLSVHPFFDIEPNWRGSKQLINYFVITPSQSAVQYDLELTSGKIYKVRDNCENQDSWQDYKDKFNTPNFSLGIIPQVYNQQKTMQKIIIFKELKADEKFSMTQVRPSEARIVGSVLMEYCERFVCDSKKTGVSTQILIGVDPLDSRFADVKTFKELNGKIDWAYARAYLQNQFGAHRVWKKTKPAYQITDELELQESLKYFKKNSIAVNMKELLKSRIKCFDLYDSLWDKMLKIRKEKNNQQEQFFDLLNNFYQKDLVFFNSCQKIIRPANISENNERHWFFSLFLAAINLEQNRFYYSCKNKSWIYNSLLDVKPLVNGELKELRICKPSELETMFDSTIKTMSTMKNQLNKFFRYIEFDTQQGGSQQKIYAWVSENSNKLGCDQVKTSPEIFPPGVYWNYLMPTKKKETDLSK